MKRFVNFSNHPSANWSKEQIEAAEKYGEICDYPFPSISATADEEEIAALADITAEKILAMNPEAVMCQGEFTLTYAVICRLVRHDVPVLAACSERQVRELPDGKKEVVFRFEGFRKYNVLGSGEDICE